MICAACGLETPDAPCAACGQPPLLDGRYRLDAVLGRGTAGTTFSAVRLSDGLPVAIKEMPLRQGDARKGRELIEREARVLRELHHPQIPAWHDDFVVGSGKHAALHLVLERIQGVDLAAELASHRYDEREVLDVVIGLLPVLVYLHGLSPPVIHRDIKPRNVMRRAGSGGLVLLDFGAVRDAVADVDLGGSTVAGTFGYMAPEQFRGDACPGSDIYAVGALAVAMLTRCEPHTLADANGVLAWASRARVSPPVQRLLDRMLDRDARRRPSDAAVLLREVRALRAGLDAPPGEEQAPSGAPRTVTLDVLRPELQSPDLPKPGSSKFGQGPGDARGLFDPQAPFAPPAVQGLAGTVTGIPARRRAGRGALAGLSGAGCMALAGFVAMAAMGIGVLVSVSRPSGSPTDEMPTFPAPSLAPPACAVRVHAPELEVPSNVSQFQFAGASEDGSRVALAVGRQSDQRAELIVYEAGARSQVDERLLKPASVPGDLPSLFRKLVTDNGSLLEKDHVSTDIQLVPAEWCQSGDAVQIAGQTWSFRTFTESCTLGFSENTSYELCPPGATDVSQCIVPPRLQVGCWSDEPRLVDVFSVGDALWAVAERPHGSTIPRFAAGVMK